jgi:photosystem II stability/assembly factor-like uncharacterized protein
LHKPPFFRIFRGIIANINQTIIIMKKYYVLMIAACFCTSVVCSQPFWSQVSSPVDEDLVSLCFIDAQHGWILSEQGTLISTNNGGISWQTAILGSGTYTSVYFVDQENGCVTGYQDSSFIMLTTDGGAVWQMSEHEKADRLNDAFFSEATHGWVVGIQDNLNFILHTTDGGQNWGQQAGPFVQGAELYSISFRDGMSGNTCGKDGAFYTTSSGGASWALDISIPALGVDMNGIANWGMLTGCAVGESGTALVTTNKWGTYVETTTNTGQTLNAVSADIATNKMWAAGESGTIIYTPNYILGWVVQNTGVTEHLHDIDMIDESSGWAVGDNGTILRFGENTAVNDKLKEQDSWIKLEAFPNPTKGVSSFRFLVSGHEHVTLNIYDLHGREVTQVLDARLPAGEHVVQAELSGLAEGMYIVEVTAENRKGRQKLVVE